MDFMSTDFNLAKNTFCFHNPKIKKVAFVLNWDTREKFYFNLLSNSFADVIDEPNDHSMVLTRPEKPNYFHPKIPAFDIRYIEDCFKIKDYPDPTQYLIKNTSHSNYTKDDIFDCWLYQKKKWSDLVSLPESKNNICKITIEPSFTDSISQGTSFNDDVDYVGYRLPDHLSKRTRLPYTHEEDTNIIQYIIKNNFGLGIKGRSLWQRMEHDNVCIRRTWQSMKERYLKSIKFALNSKYHRFSFLTPEELKILQQGFNNDAEFIVSPDHSNMASSSKTLPYTLKEDTNIVQYIVKNNNFLFIKGRAMWQQMENDKVCKRRSWQSMKERYLKTIKVALMSGNHRFPFLTPEDLKILQQGEQMNEKDEEATKSGFKKERLNYWSSDSS
ncbi:uncharacterized protein LOC111027666 isoform X3 [Myzus persicae]|uniref:uncharacterized protein LOC111027666 isoform X3 n=1 Tax=Myzus persicae TaxID=13164 RepID=UPI000B9314EA|nr:uncharacterized protein LOC111027666 isoform X3 [Myzus persicae]